jgi:hypothetical protein
LEMLFLEGCVGKVPAQQAFSRSSGGKPADDAKTFTVCELGSQEYAKPLVPALGIGSNARIMDVALSVAGAGANELTTVETFDEVDGKSTRYIPGRGTRFLQRGFGGRRDPRKASPSAGSHLSREICGIRWMGLRHGYAFVIVASMLRKAHERFSS